MCIVIVMCVLFFFFSSRRRHTRWNCDWSSDVCSSDLGKLVAQGGLTTGRLHALVAMDLPGPGTVFLSQNWKFTAPVYLGDTITAEAEVVSVHATKPVCQLRVVVKREDGETVLEGEAWCYTLAAEGGTS